MGKVRAMKVLFVCLGNICRSPTAEAAFRAACPEIVCDSAGTGDWHLGDPPHPPMQAAAKARGLDMADLRARQFAAEDFDRFDLIIAMDADNVREIELLRPAGNRTPVRLLTSYAPDGGDSVPDPYLTRNFEETLDIVERAVEGLAAHVRGERAS